MSARNFTLSLPFIVAIIVPSAAWAGAGDDGATPPAASDTASTEPSNTSGSGLSTVPDTTSSTSRPATTLTPHQSTVEGQRAEEEAKEGRINNALITPAGVYGFVGGGATNFTEPDATSGTDAGGYWDARIGIGTRSILGAEVGYVGSARDVSALGVGEDAFLMSNGVEGVARLNVPLTPGDGLFLIEPYTFGGIGWNRYNVVSEASVNADSSNEDDIMTVPMGVGLAFGFSGVTLDARATYRQAIGSDLFGSDTSSFAETSLNSWAAGAAVGFEF